MSKLSNRRGAESAERKRERRLSALCYLILIFLLAACGGDGEQAAQTGPTPTPLPTPVVPEKPTYTVQRGTVVKTLEFTGRVSPVQEQELFFKSDGFVDQVFVARGDRVQAGDVLAQLEITELEGQLAQAQVALQTAEINLEKAKQELDDQLVEAEINLEKLQLQLAQGQAEADSASLTSASIELSRAQQRVADAAYEYQKALDRHWEPEHVVDSYARSLQRAEEDLIIAEANYNDTVAAGNTGAYDSRILQLDRELAQLTIDQLQRGVDPLLELDVEKAKLEIADIERQIADARLIAPFAGEVLSINARAGDRAEAFNTVLVLADPDQLEVTAALGDDALSEMSVGQEATIRLRNRPDDDFAGFVRQLPYPYSGGAADAAEAEDDAARIAFVDEEVELELGELATVVIVLEEKEDVLWLPPAAIRSFQGRNFVVVQDGDGQRRVDVRLGIESEERVEIVEGVTAGQTVVGE